jgi:hypothetical protein
MPIQRFDAEQNKAEEFLTRAQGSEQCLGAGDFGILLQDPNRKTVWLMEKGQPTAMPPPKVRLVKGSESVLQNVGSRQWTNSLEDLARALFRAVKCGAEHVK